MCGIFGFVGAPDRARAIDLEAALRSLHHRGPDDRGVFQSWMEADSSSHSRESGNRFRRTPTQATPAFAGVTDGGGNVACAFAHTRLAIIDVSAAGHQPMTTPDGRYTIVYNGEVFNYQEIREELGVSCEELVSDTSRPHVLTSSHPGLWRSNSDTEVILAAYARWGADCVERLRGMFAFAIWDREERSLFLARDRLGIKPLYYTETPKGLAFASEVRTLLATGLAERRLDPDSLRGYLAFGSVPGPATILQGVRALPPGFSAVFEDSRLSTRRYWSLPPEATPGELPDLLELHNSLRDAVRLRLISDVPLGVFLSGGIDSTALVALAAAASETPIHTFTVTFDEEPYNEETFAAEVASRFGCDHHQVHLSASRAATEIDGTIRALDQPSADGVNTYFVAKAAREAGLMVTLSGLGGDELFAGYRNFRSFGMILKAGAAARFLPFTRGNPGAKAFDRMPHRLRKLRALLAAQGDPARSYAILRGMFLRDERDSILNREFTSPLTRDSELLTDTCRSFDSRENRDAVNLYSRLEISNYLRNTLLRDTDAMSMANSLELRVPFLDHLLVERVLAIPGSQKIAGRHNKPLLTAAVPEIPEQIVRRRKMGFTLPMDSWFRGPLKEWMSERLSEESTRSVGFLRPEGVSRLWSSFLRGERYTSWSRVWSVAALVSWCRENGVSACEPDTRSMMKRHLGTGRGDALMSSPRKRGSLAVGVGASRRPARVLLILPAAFATAGGIEMYNRLLVGGFGDVILESGGSCDVLILNDGPNDFDPRYVAPGQSPPWTFSRSKWRLIVAAFEKSMKLKPDLVVFGHLNFAPLAALLKFASPRSKQWFFIYGIDAWHRLGPVHRRTVRKSDLVLSISEFTKNEFARLNDIDPDRVKLLPCALDPFFGSERTSPPARLRQGFGASPPLQLERGTGGEVGAIEQSSADSPLPTPHPLPLTPHSSRPPTLLTVARLSKADEYKGLDQVLRALPEIAREIPGVRYVIVGDGDGRARLEELSRSLGVASRVEFRGRVSAPALAHAYSESSLFVMPSSKEGFGIVFLEAAHFGKPAIAGRHGGSPEVVLDGATGRIVDREDIRGLTDAIVELLRNPAELDRLGRNAKQRLDELYTYERFRENLKGLLSGQEHQSSPPVPLSSIWRGGGDPSPLHMVERGGREDGVRTETGDVIR